jgi:hypothetical protein
MVGSLITVRHAADRGGVIHVSSQRGDALVERYLGQLSFTGTVSRFRFITA